MDDENLIETVYEALLKKEGIKFGHVEIYDKYEREDAGGICSQRQRKHGIH